FLERRLTGINHHVVLEVDNLFEAGGLHVEQRAQPARHRLEEPNVDDGSGELDMPRALAADAAVRDFDAATVADHAFVLQARVFAAGALPILLRTEDALAEKAVLFGPISSVVDGFRLLDFAKRPAANIVGTRQADANRAVIVDSVVIHFASAHVRPPKKPSAISIQLSARTPEADN